jgi:hypothetical protein
MLKINFLGMFSSFHNRDHPAGFRVSNRGAGSVCAKPNDHLAISDSAKPAGLTGDIFPDLGRAHDDRPPARCIGFGRGVHWHNGTHWACVSFHQGISFPSVISGQVNGEPPVIRVPNPVQGIRAFFVGVSKPTASNIGADDLTQGGGVQIFARSWQIARYIVTPQGPSRQGGD